jgi:hypothetical protein
MDIQATITKYTEGYLKAKSAFIAEVFLEEAWMFDGKNGTAVKDWIGSIKERESKGDIRTAETAYAVLDRTESTAVVRVTLKFQGYDFVDYLSLVKRGEWKIASKVYHKVVH